MDATTTAGLLGTFRSQLIKEGFDEHEAFAFCDVVLRDYLRDPENAVVVS